MLFCLLFTHLDHGAAAKSAAEALLISAGLTAIAGILLVLMGMGKVQKIPRREGVVIVGLGWILSGIFGAIPYMLCEPVVRWFRDTRSFRSGSIGHGSGWKKSFSE